MRTALLVLVLVVGCKPKHQALSRDACLALPHAPRRALKADPNGDGLYWIERVAARDYDGIDVSYERLVRYDVKRQQADVIVERVVGPLHFAKDGSALVVAKSEKTGALVQIRDGRIQALVPSWFDVKDVEPIEGNRFALLAGADSKWSIFVLDLDRPRPTHLVDADVLLSATHDLVFVRDGVESYAVNVATGEKTPREVPSAALPDRDLVYFVESSVVKARSLRTGDVTTVVPDQREWTLVHQLGSVLARAGTPKTERYTYALAQGTATALPVIAGGASIVGSTQLGGDTWTLVGHNTSNYDGDLWLTTHEADVCALDRKRDRLTFETRTLPARYAARSRAFWDASAKFPNTTWQMLDIVGDPPTVFVETREAGGKDLDAMRDRVRAYHKAVTSLLDDDEVRTSITFADGRVAAFRWRRERLRGRSLAGIGDVALTDPAEFDVELANVIDEKTEDAIRCSGKVTNLRAVTLVGIEVRCIAGDQTRVIAVPKLEPQRSFTFSEQYALRENDNPVVEVFRGREMLVVRDLKSEITNRLLYDFFVALHAETGLWLRAHDTNNQFLVVLDVDRDTDLDEVNLDEVKRAYGRIDRVARAYLGIATDVELALRLYVGRLYYDWNGEKLTLAN